MKITNFIIHPYIRFKNEVTTQDLFKAFALLIMIIDHFGVYFFPDHQLLRVIGRISSVIWFFFVGYNFKPNKFNVTDILFCAVALSAIEIYLFKIQAFRLNILFSIIICRIVIYYLDLALKERFFSRFEWGIMSIFSILLYRLSNLFFEYGLMGVLVAIWGYNLRKNDPNKLFQAIAIAFTICITQISSFHFSFINSFLCVILVSLTIYALYQYRQITLNIAGISKYIINISARYSLYLYLIHMVIFMYISCYIFLSTICAQSS